MKIVCPKCGALAEAQDVKMDGSLLTWRCGACEKRVRQDVEVYSDEAAPHAVVEQASEPEAPLGKAEQPAVEVEEPTAKAEHGQLATCPKCGAPKTDRSDCPRCGLVFELWNPDAQVVPEALEDAWIRVEEAFGDDALHQKFLSVARQMGRLDVAAGRYRSWADAHPDDEATATRLDQVLMLVEAEALMPSPRPDQTTGWRRLLPWALVALLVILLIYLLVAPHPKYVHRTSTGPGPGQEPVNLVPPMGPGGAPVNQVSPMGPGGVPVNQVSPLGIRGGVAPRPQPAMTGPVARPRPAEQPAMTTGPRSGAARPSSSSPRPHSAMSARSRSIPSGP